MNAKISKSKTFSFFFCPAFPISLTCVFVIAAWTSIENLMKMIHLHLTFHLERYFFRSRCSSGDSIPCLSARDLFLFRVESHLQAIFRRADLLVRGALSTLDLLRVRKVQLLPFLSSVIRPQSSHRLCIYRFCDFSSIFALSSLFFFSLLAIQRVNCFQKYFDHLNIFPDLGCATLSVSSATRSAVLSLSVILRLIVYVSLLLFWTSCFSSRSVPSKLTQTHHLI